VMRHQKLPRLDRKSSFQISKSWASRSQVVKS